MEFADVFLVTPALLLDCCWRPVSTTQNMKYSTAATYPVARITYTVLVETLNPAQSINQRHINQQTSFGERAFSYAGLAVAVAV